MQHLHAVQYVVFAAGAKAKYAWWWCSSGPFLGATSTRKICDISLLRRLQDSWLPCIAVCIAPSRLYFLWFLAEALGLPALDSRLSLGIVCSPASLLTSQSMGLQCLNRAISPVGCSWSV